MSKLTIELDMGKQGEEYTPEQLRFIERHVFGNLAWLLEQGGLGDLITPEVDWDNQEEAERLFGETETDGGLDKNLDHHMDAAGLVIGYLDQLYDVAIAGVASRGGTYVSMYEGGRNGQKVPETEETEDEMPVPTETPFGVTNGVSFESTNTCALCNQDIESAVMPVMIGDKIYHIECGLAMTRAVEETNAGSE